MQSVGLRQRQRQPQREVAGRECLCRECPAARKQQRDRYNANDCVASCGAFWRGVLRRGHRREVADHEDENADADE